jgi:hypothetical protein
MARKEMPTVEDELERAGHSANAPDTFRKECLAFMQRHEGEPTIQLFGGLFWGLLRAFAECPNCPGVFRVPLDEEGLLWACPKCKGFWSFGTGG